METPQTSHPVKGEDEPREPVPANISDPFPVPCDSMYYDSTAPPDNSKPLTSSVDRILHKYLKDATTEREVTSSTAPQNIYSEKVG